MKDNLIYSCFSLNNFTLTFEGQIDINKNLLGLCYEPLEGISALSLCEPPEIIIKRLCKIREQMLSEGERSLSDIKRTLTKTCIKCYKYRLMKPPKDGLIHYIRMASYPVLCQSNCIYCDSTRHNIRDVSVFDKESIVIDYERIFSIIEYAQKKGKVASDVVWRIVTGEISVHPYKERIYNLIGSSHACFFTNCFIFDDRIANNLVMNPNSSILFSIDAGTSETWNKVKRRNNFSYVISNLKKYRTSGCHPEQVRLKYILLPGINDNIEDYIGIVEVMKALNISNLEIAREANAKNLGQEFIDGAALLSAYLVKNNLTMQLFSNSFTASESEMIISRAKNI